MAASGSVVRLGRASSLGSGGGYKSSPSLSTDASLLDALLHCCSSSAPIPATSTTGNFFTVGSLKVYLTSQAPPPCTSAQMLISLMPQVLCKSAGPPLHAHV